MRWLRLGVALLLAAGAATVGVAAQGANGPNDDGQGPASPPSLGFTFASATLNNVVVEQAACGRVRVTGDFMATADTDDGGGVDNGSVVVYDDGVLIGSVDFSTLVGVTAHYQFLLVVTHTIGTPGVAVSIREFAADPGAITFVNEAESAIAECPELAAVVVSFGTPVPTVPMVVLMVMGVLLSAVVLWRLRSRQSRIAAA